MYCIDAKTIIEPIEEEGRFACSYLDENNKSLFVDWDGKVILCCYFRADESFFSYSFLDVSMENIQRDRQSHALCKKCMEYGLNC